MSGIEIVRRVHYGLALSELEQNQGLSMCEAQEQLERVIARMQVIQRAIRSSRQPASMFELQELKDLGREYASLVEDLAKTLNDPSRG